MRGMSLYIYMRGMTFLNARNVSHCWSPPWPSFSSSSYRPCPRGPRPSARSTSSQSAGGEGARQRHLHWQSAAPTAIVPCQLMAEQHTFHHCNHARKQTGELVAMLVEEPLLVNPSGRLDFLLCAHPPSFSPLRHGQRCRKYEKQANLESGDTQEAALSHWDHEGSRAGADGDTQLNVERQRTAASEVHYVLYYLIESIIYYLIESACGKMTLQRSDQST